MLVRWLLISFSLLLTRPTGSVEMQLSSSLETSRPFNLIFP